ncbi:hypothetical protein GW17_00044208 [Ensete ventricosum]|nr:hypothetical protein GW17_00044208 [Ensete ventricosum]
MKENDTSRASSLSSLTYLRRKVLFMQTHLLLYHPSIATTSAIEDLSPILRRRAEEEEEEMAREALAVAAEAQVALKKKTAAARSWILLDSSGEGTILDVDKYAIMHRVQIHARDLRILDPLLSYPSTILGRERAIVLNLEVAFFVEFG